MGRFDNKIALVTGASKGIGRATAIAFAKEGATVVLASRSLPKFQSEFGELDPIEYIKELGSKASFIPFDATEPESIKNLVSKTVDMYGRIDIAFNNAGIFSGAGYMHEKPDDDFEKTISVDLKAVWYCCKYVLAQMVQQETGGKVVNSASINGLHASNKQADYCTAKGGVVNLTRALAFDYGPFNINVNCVCPGWVTTEMMEQFREGLASYQAGMPLRRASTPEDVAGVVLFLCSEEARQITGQPILIDGGASVLPPRPVAQL